MKRTVIAALGAAVIATFVANSAAEAAIIGFSFGAFDGSMTHDGASLDVSTVLDLDSATFLVMEVNPGDSSGLADFDPDKVSYASLLKVFWESHNPTQGMRQGNDVGSQYRSAIFYHSPEQQAIAEESKIGYQKRLSEAGYGEITTEIVPATEFYFAEGYHQQYLSEKKNPYGYCPDHGTGVSCPIGVVTASGPVEGIQREQ